MGCASCASKYAALKASRQKNAANGALDKTPPRAVKPPRRGVIRKAEKLQMQQIVETPPAPPEVSIVNEEVTNDAPQTDSSN